MTELFEAAAHIQTGWALAAFAIASVVFVVVSLLSKRAGKTLSIGTFVAAIASITLLGLVAILAQLSSSAIYHVRVTVLAPQGMPQEDAKVWSSMGGEPKKVAGGWQFDIPAAARPSDGKLTLWASLDTAYLKGSRQVQLDSDHNPAVAIQLGADNSATVRGLITDRTGHAVAGARITVVGYEYEAALTQAGGNFTLPAHAARDQNVLLHAEAKNYLGSTQYHPAGDSPATIVLTRK